MARLDNKVAIITGAAKGLGEANARMFANEGAKVVLTDVDSENGERVAKEIGAAAIFVKHDVRHPEDWENVIEKTVNAFGGLNILVNNAGVVEVGTIENQTLKEYEFVMDVSARGTFLGCQLAIPEMKKSGSGSIINMASIASVQGEPYVIAYNAAKGAVEALTRGVAVHCAKSKYNIRCNSVHPSGIITPMVMSMPGKMEASSTGRFMADIDSNASSKLGEPNDIAYTVLFLASDESKFINGAQIRVDNAMSVVAGVVPK